MGLLDRMFGSREQARNAALDHLEDEGVEFNGKTKPVTQKWGRSAGREVGVESTDENQPWWRLRHDYDPDSGPHYNAERGKGRDRSNQHFGYPGDEDTYERNTRKPRNR